MIGLILTILDFGLVLLMLYIAHESYYEHESQATMISLFGAVLHLALMYVILYMPNFRVIPLGYFALIGVVAFLLLIPRKPNLTALSGIRGYVIGEAPRPDERDSVTRRYRLVKGTPAYDEYYGRHPERKEIDRVHRKLNRIDGTIDGGYRPNVAMIDASFSIPPHMKGIAFAEPKKESYEITPEKTTMIAKGLAKHLGAKVVGICKVDPLCVYTNQRTLWEKMWTVDGEEQDYPPYALVMATEMSHTHVHAGPHTPTAAETGNQYANGSSAPSWPTGSVAWVTPA